MAKRALKGINWAAITERVIEREKPNFLSFKATSDGYLRKMTANPETPPKIDWDYYKKTVMVPGLVDRFRKEYEALTIPYPEDNVSDQIETKKQQYVAEKEIFTKESENRIKVHQEGIEKIKNMVAIEHMTQEDFVEYYPELSPCDLDNPTFFPHDPEDQFHLIPGEYERLQKLEEEEDDH